MGARGSIQGPGAQFGAQGLSSGLGSGPRCSVRGPGAQFRAQCSVRGPGLSSGPRCSVQGPGPRFGAQLAPGQAHSSLVSKNLFSSSIIIIIIIIITHTLPWSAELNAPRSKMCQLEPLYAVKCWRNFKHFLSYVCLVMSGFKFDKTNICLL